MTTIFHRVDWARRWSLSCVCCIHFSSTFYFLKILFSNPLVGGTDFFCCTLRPCHWLWWRTNVTNFLVIQLSVAVRTPYILSTWVLKYSQYNLLIFTLCLMYAVINRTNTRTRINALNRKSNFINYKRTPLRGSCIFLIENITCFIVTTVNTVAQTLRMASRERKSH